MLGNLTKTFTFKNCKFVCDIVGNCCIFRRLNFMKKIRLNILLHMLVPLSRNFWILKLYDVGSIALETGGQGYFFIVLSTTFTLKLGQYIHYL